MLNTQGLENEVINDKCNHFSSCLLSLIIKCYLNMNGNDQILFGKYLLLTQQILPTMCQVVVSQVKGNPPRISQEQVE